jgi:Fe-S cluster assembly ATP-binding protein
MLEVKNLSFTVPGTETGIINDVSFTLEDGKFLVLTGPNGGGKSTLARLIMGIEQPTAGQIVFNGEDITGLSLTERAKKGIGYAFQQPPRFKGLTVRRLLSLASGRDLPENECCAYLTKVGLCSKDYLNRAVDASLSGGEVKRIEIATILAREPALMILDEPEAGIDLWSFTRLTETFEEIHRKGSCTMIIISHQERIISLADNVVVVDRGVVSRQGTAAEILPSIVSGTTGDCPMIGKEA